MNHCTVRNFYFPAIALSVLSLSAAIFSLPVNAGPWAEPGDLRLRHDVQLLSDAGVIRAPVTTWPLSWGDLGDGLDEGERSSSPMIRAAARRVNASLAHLARAHRWQAHARLAVTGNAAELRGFVNAPREEAEVQVGADWLGDRFAHRLQVTAVADAQDGQHLRPDGSYAAVSVGNWMLSAGWLDRWWGPGWESSLIYSNNARPIPSLAVQRNESRPFGMPILRWLGPWQLVSTLGQLDDDATIPDTLFFSMRVNFKPVQDVEIGLSRTAQWGGEGRGEGFDTFLDMIAGKDNAGDEGVSRSDQPGNQLGGFDVRWTSPLFDLPYAVYAQAVGEDEAGGLPSKYIGLVGAEAWGAAAGGYTYRVHAEYADTAASFYDDPPHFNTAYRHSVYTSGYRYRGRVIGHGIATDGRIASLGAVAVDEAGNAWDITLSRAQYERDVDGPVQLVLAGGYAWRRAGEAWSARAAVVRTHQGGKEEVEASISAQWTHTFR